MYTIRSLWHSELEYLGDNNGWMDGMKVAHSYSFLYASVQELVFLVSSSPSSFFPILHLFQPLVFGWFNHHYVSKGTQNIRVCIEQFCRLNHLSKLSKTLERQWGNWDWCLSSWLSLRQRKLCMTLRERELLT